MILNTDTMWGPCTTTFFDILTHWGRVTHMRQQSNYHWFRRSLDAWTAPSHYLNQWWNIVNWTLRNKLQWHFNRNLNIFIQENALEDVVCEMASIFSRPQCVKQIALALIPLPLMESPGKGLRDNAFIQLLSGRQRRIPLIKQTPMHRLSRVLLPWLLVSIFIRTLLLNRKFACESTNNKHTNQKHSVCNKKSFLCHCDLQWKARINDRSNVMYVCICLYICVYLFMGPSFVGLINEVVIAAPRPHLPPFRSDIYDTP